MEWIRMDEADIDAAGVWAPYATGARVHVREDSAVDPGRAGSVVCWGRGTEADRMFRELYPVLKDGAYEVLCDSEGPVVRFDDQPEGDETLHWFPGQAMPVLEVVPA
jgi:hypothetical protein